MDIPLQQFLRTSPRWSWRAFTIFCLAMIFCTMQAVPSWAHPDWHLGWDPRFCVLLVGICGAVTGFLTAKYRFPGLVAGALAGSGSIVAAIVIMTPIHSFSRIVMALVGIVGFLPGIGLYCLLHIMIERLGRMSSKTMESPLPQ